MQALCLGMPRTDAAVKLAAFQMSINDHVSELMRFQPHDGV